MYYFKMDVGKYISVETFRDMFKVCDSIYVQISNSPLVNVSMYLWFLLNISYFCYNYTFDPNIPYHLWTVHIYIYIFIYIYETF